MSSRAPTATSATEAFSALDGGDVEKGRLRDGFEELEAASDDDRERLRKAIVAVLDELGVEHPLARESRRRLAAARCTAAPRVREQHL